MFSDMLVAEKRLLEACQKGELLILSDNRPFQKTDDNEIRGEFLRHLILNNNQEIEESSKKYILKIDPKGIRFSGVYVSEKFDFSFCSTELPFYFKSSVFEKEIDISESKIRFLNLHNCKVTGINGQGLFCQSDIFLRDGFEANEKIDFNSAYIVNLDCRNGKFINENGDALICDGAKIKGSVFLNEGFESKGKVKFASSEIGSNLECTKGKFINEKGDALNCDKAKISGSVFLINGFEAKGEVDFHSCFIGKSLIFSKANEISFFRLNSAQISRLSLDFEKVKETDLNGCIYEHLDSKIFSKLFEKMPKEDDFKPQPYKQLAKVLRNMGHQKEANDIMIKYNDIITSQSETKFIKILKLIYGTTAGYGYKPMKVIKCMTIVWFLCSLFYWKASSVAVFAPSNPLIFQHKDYKVKIADEGTAIGDFFNSKDYKCEDEKLECNNWINSKLLDEEYTTFNPFMYSLDVILPIVDLQVEKDWGQYIPSNDWTLNDFTRWIMWFEILFGWIYSLILVAILSGLAKNEKD